MSDSSPNRVTFERALKRGKTRPKRHREGGQHQEPSQRLEQHQELPLMDSMSERGKLGKRLHVKHAEGSQVLKTLGSTRSTPPPPPPTDVPLAISPLRPSQ